MKAKDNLNKIYWSERYQQGTTGWDIGYPSPPLINFVKQLDNMELKILIPGCGKAHEAKELHALGFTDVYVLDIAREPLDHLKSMVPDFPEEHLICQDFFDHTGAYDLLLEQTFFCAIDPTLRIDYVRHAAELLKPGGHLAGVLWGVEMNTEHPPFGGSRDEYDRLFSPYFKIVRMEPATDSIEPRLGKELFVLFEKIGSYRD